MQEGRQVGSQEVRIARTQPGRLAGMKIGRQTHKQSGSQTG